MIATGNIIVRLLLALFLAATTSRAASRLEDALELQAKGRLKESGYCCATPFRSCGRAEISAGWLRALSAAAKVLPSHAATIPMRSRNATEAIVLLTRLHDDAAVSPTYNTLGLANLYLGNYSEALENYQKALKLDREHHRSVGEVTLQNNIGNIYYFQGRYQDALRVYQSAMDQLNSAGEQKVGRAAALKLTIANLAVLYQRLGKDQTALELYRQLTGKPQALPRTEFAQLLLNEGVLYRRPGRSREKRSNAIRPRKPSLLRSTIAMRKSAHSVTSELCARWIWAILTAHARAFTQALNLARESSDARGVIQAALHRAEVYTGAGSSSRPSRRTIFHAGPCRCRRKSDWSKSNGRRDTAWGDWRKSQGHPDAAADLYLKAIAGIESVRAGMRTATLRSEFLADKRDVYDALIGLSGCKRRGRLWTMSFLLSEQQE